jgi:HK97 family phage major capsid protein
MENPARALPSADDQALQLRKLPANRRAAALRDALRDQVLHSELRFERGSIDEKARTVRLSFASEDPYRRWWGVEILDCAPGSVRMVRFGRGAFADEIFRDVIDGVRTKVSVGYRIHELVLEKETEDVSTYRVTDWEPLEVSIVSVPADATVGVGRSTAQAAPWSPSKERSTMKAESSAPEAVNETPAAKLAGDLARSNQTARQAAFNEMAERNAAMQDIAKRFEHVPGVQDAYAHAHVNAKMTVDAFREVVLDLVEKHQATPTRTGQLEADRLDRGERNAYGDGARVVIQGSVRAFKGVGERVGMSDLEAAYRSGQFLRVALFGNQDAARWCMDAGVDMRQGKFDGATAVGQRIDMRALTGGIFSSAGWLLPSELSTAIIINREEYGVSRRICNVMPMSTASMPIPRLTSGVTAYFVGEGTEGTQSDPEGDQVTLTLKDLMATTRIGNSTAQDAAVPLAEMVAREQARARAVKEDACLILGNGTSTYGGMMGVRTLLNNADYSGNIVAAASGHDTFAEIDNGDVTQLIGRLPVYARAGARFLVSGTGDANVFGRLKLTAGGNTVQSVQGRIVEGEYAGFPITIAHDMPDSPTNGEVCIVLGNFELGVAFGAGQGMMMTVDPYTRAKWNQTEITTVERIDINAHGIIKTTATASRGCIIGLDATT